MPNRTTSLRWTSSDTLTSVLVLGVLARFAARPLWRVPVVQAWTLVFGAVCVQAAPYVVLGALVSSLLAAAPARWVRRALPRRDALAVPVGAVLGAALPGCECGTVPVARSLLRRGVPAGPAVALMLSGPATNPIVLAATAAAYPGRPGVVLARFAASWCVAVGTGFVMRRTAADTVGADHDAHQHEHGLSPGALLTGAAHDLAQSLGLVTIGAASAATVGVLVPEQAIDAVAHGAVGGVAALAVLAVVFAVCSEADAFVASSLTRFSLTAQLTFMVVGPAVDLKLVAMHVGAFGRRFAVRLDVAAFALAVGCAVLATAAFT